MFAMPRRRVPKEYPAPAGDWRTLSPQHPDAWPQAIVFDLECVAAASVD
jgi:hypothetical protein